MSSRIPSSLFLFGLALALTPATFADSIVSSNGIAEAEVELGGSFSSQILEVSWTASSAYSNVSIAAEVGLDGQSSPISAWLTTAIGPTETAADQIASASFSPVTGDEVDTIFSGLNLAPGTYYLVLTGGFTGLADSWWSTIGPATTATAAGVTFGGDGAANSLSMGAPNYTSPAASAFVSNNGLGLLFQVTGSVVSAESGESGLSVAPEPGSLSLTLAGCLGALWLWKRKALGLN
jgi:hypothetical protein